MWNISIYRLRYLQFVVAFYSHYKVTSNLPRRFHDISKTFILVIFCVSGVRERFVPQCYRPATKMQRCVKVLCTCWVVSFSCSVQYLQSPAAFRLFLPHHLLLSLCKLMIVLIRQIHWAHVCTVVSPRGKRLYVCASGAFFSGHWYRSLFYHSAV